MSGKGLAFLNKKGWHVGTIRNQEKVWKAEQDALAEKKKIEERRKEIEEERRIQELQQVKDSALPGHKKQARLEWMYQGMAAWQQASTDEYLKGKPIAETKDERGAEGKELGLFRNRTITPQQDAWAKLRDDPLLEIRKQAQEQIAHLKKNPVQMEKIKQQLLEQARASKAASSAPAPASDAKPARSRSPQHTSPRRRSPSPRRYSRGDDEKRAHSNGDRRSPERRRSRSRSPERRRRSRSPARSPRRDRRSRSPRPRSPPRHSSSNHRPHNSHKKQEMSAEERERRLAAMKSDAETHHEDRYRRIKAEAAEAAKEEKETPNPEKLNFLHDVNKSVYDAKATSVEDRLQRNRHFRQNATSLEESGIATRT